MAKEIETAETTEDEVLETEAEDVIEDADNDEEVEFDDDSEEADGDDEEASDVKKDLQEESKPKEPEQKKSWKNEANAEAARRRREAEQAVAIKKARVSAVIDALGGENPYTNEKMVDEADVDEYLLMKQIEKDGKDPIGDYPRYLKNKNKEQKKVEQEKAIEDDWYAKDSADFAEKYPDVHLAELEKDEMFRIFAGGKIGKIPLSDIYAGYKAAEKIIEDRAKIKAAQILANGKSNPGKISNKPPEPEKSITKMSKKDFEVMIERVKRGEIK